MFTDYLVRESDGLSQPIKCKDGTILDIQAGKGLYCEPKLVLPYSDYVSFEIMSNCEVPALEEHKEYDKLYSYVPVLDIIQAINDCGGILC